MADEPEEEKSGEDRRRDPRHEPYKYLPHAEIMGDNPISEERLVGFIRNESQQGFSAEFNQFFPYEEGDVLDVRVGYQRAWARVVWIERLNEDLFVVGFRLHPEDFLKARE